MKPIVQLELPYPPSVNTYWRNVGNRTIISRRGRSYRSQVNSIVKQYGFDLRLFSLLEIQIEAYPPDSRKRDIDNISKAILDSLAKAGVFIDDSQIKKQTIEMFEPMKPKGMIYVEIKAYTGYNK